MTHPAPSGAPRVSGVPRGAYPSVCVCPHYALLRANLWKAAGAARALGVEPLKHPPFRQALGVARYHRETCPDCDAEFISAFPELARAASHTVILSHEVVEVEA